MAKIQRATQKIFAGKGKNDPIAVFGSMKTGNPIYTDNLEDLQSVAYENGWADAIVADEAPFLEEMNGIQYGFSKQLAYIFQEGLPEYDTETPYYVGSWCKGTVDNAISIYESLTDENIGNPLTNETHWKKVNLGSSSGGTSLPLGTPVIMDHILPFEKSEGYALQGTYVYKTGIAGSRYGYREFVDQWINYKNAGTATEVTLGENTITMYINANGLQFYDIADKAAVDEWFNTYGVAYFYGIDEENERVFMPRKKLYYGTNSTASVACRGNGMSIGVTNGSTNFGLSGAGLYVFGKTGSYGQNAGAAASGNNFANGNGINIALSSDPTKSGIVGEADTSSILKEDETSYLYFVVGNTTEITHVTTTIPDSEILSQVNQNTTDILNKVDLTNTQWAANACMPNYANKTIIENANTWYIASSASMLTYPCYRTSEALVVSISPDQETTYDIRQHYSTNVSGLTVYCISTLFIPKGWSVKFNQTDPTVKPILYALFGGN